MAHCGFGADEIYHPVTGTVHAITDKGVLFEPEDGVETFWVPRQCIRGVDEKALESVSRGETMTIHAMEWIWRKHGVL